LSGQKQSYQKKFDMVRQSISASKTKMISAGTQQMGLLKRNVNRANFFVFCATLMVVILGGLF
jgi:hypothetical protein